MTPVRNTHENVTVVRDMISVLRRHPPTGT